MVRLGELLIAGQCHVSGLILSYWHGLIHGVLFEVLLICVGLTGSGAHIEEIYTNNLMVRKITQSASA